jgi:hypothetical protein
MTDMTVYAGGGFGDAGLDRASPSLRARIAAADAEYEREALVEERAAQALRAIDEEARIRLSIRMAQDRGEVVSVRQAYADGGVGRTPREVIEYMSAAADVDDQRLEAQRRAAVAKLNLEWYGQHSVDTSAPTQAEQSDEVTMRAKATAYRAKQEAERKATARAVRAARMDREGRS